MVMNVLIIVGLLIYLIGYYAHFAMVFESDFGYKTYEFNSWALTVELRVKPLYLAEIRKEYPDAPEVMTKRIF